MDDKLNGNVNQQAILTFNLENPDAEVRLKKMLNVENYSIALYDFNQFLRNFLKHGEGEKVHFKSFDEYRDIVPDYDTMEYVRTMFYECLKNNNVNLDD